MPFLYFSLRPPLPGPLGPRAVRRLCAISPRNGASSGSNRDPVRYLDCKTAGAPARSGLPSPLDTVRLTLPLLFEIPWSVIGPALLSNSIFLFYLASDGLTTDPPVVVISIRSASGASRAVHRHEAGVLVNGVNENSGRRAKQVSLRPSGALFWWRSFQAGVAPPCATSRRKKVLRRA